MSDIPDEDEDQELPDTPPPPRKTSRLAWAVVWVIFLVVLIEIFSMTNLPDKQKTAETFQRIGSTVGPVQR